ncbi:MAG TPA: response regulator transcription factor [Terriglobales bacterium]
MKTRIKSEPIHVVVADSDQIRRQLLVKEFLRQSNLKVVASGTDSMSIRSVLAEVPADVMLMAESIECDHKHVLLGIREALAVRPSLRCVAMLEALDREIIVGAFRAGARGLVSLKKSSLKELAKCITCVSRDEIWATNAQVLCLIDAFKRSSAVAIVNAKGHSLLTPKQQKLVELVAEGMGNREVAQHLNVTENTVKKSLLRIFDKVGVSNRVELVLCALARKDDTSGDHDGNGKLPVRSIAALEGNNTSTSRAGNS